MPAGRRLAPLTLLLAVAATAAWAVILLGGGAVGGSSAWTWGGLLLAFALAEGTQLHVELRRQAVSLSLSELPLVLALFLVDPVVLLATRLGAGLLVAVVRRARPYKSAFNLALFSGEGALAVLLFSAVSGGAEQGPRAWLAAYAATVAVSTVTGLLLLAAMAVLQGRMQRADAVVWLGPLVTGALLSTSAALLALLVVGADPRALPVLLLLLVLLVGGYRAYGTLLRRHRVLEQLQTFTAVMGAGGSRDELLAQALSHARTLLSADCAEILVRSSTDGRLRAVRQCADQQPPARLVQDDAVVAALLAGAGPRLVPRGTSDAHEQAWLDALGMRDALAVPVTGSTGVVGVLVVGQRLGDLGSFTQADVGLLEMVATHLEIALRSTDLVERLRHEATHDALTGLPNRTLFAERVAAAIEDRRPGGEFAVLLMDLDGFKDVNDTLGHESGDLVLVQVARRLEAAVADDVTVARLGGDEFCMLVPLGPGRDDVAAVVERMHDGLRLPCPVGGVELEVRASVGAALCPQHGDDGSVLLRHADVAMYAGKAAHLPLQVYGPDIDRSNPRRLALVNELRAAVEDRLLACHYQPKVRVADGTVTGVEALVRWQHPVLGNVPPDDFIPIAEHTGVIVALTSLVLRTALEQSAAWSALGHDLDVAVNVSPRALLSPSFLDEVATLLRDTRVPARRLTLEVTESSVMTEPARAIGVLHSLHALGVQLSVDDFGTGYSSLAYLQRLPVHEVKIDKSFVRDLAVAAGDSAIVRAIVDLGHSLGLRVVAEGVEDARSLAVLREMGCDTAQGYLVSRPLPPDRLLTWLDASAGSPVVPPPRERVLS